MIYIDLPQVPRVGSAPATLHSVSRPANLIRRRWRFLHGDNPGNSAKTQLHLKAGVFQAAVKLGRPNLSPRKKKDFSQIKTEL